MKKRDFKRTLFEHTDLFTIDDIPFARSGADAQRIIDAGGCASFATTLRRAMIQADMTDETRKIATRILEQAERKELRREPKAVLRRRAVIAAAATVVLSYFTLVPQGRALAKSIYEFVVNFFENGIIIVENEGRPDDGSYGYTIEPADIPPSIAPKDNNHEERTITTTYGSIQEFVEDVGKNPVVLNNPEVKLKEVLFNKNDEIGLYKLIIIYDYHGADFQIIQDWSADAPMAYSAGTDEYFYKNFMDKQIICSVDPDSDSLDGLLILEDSIVMISTDNLPETEALFNDLALFKNQ